VFTWSDYEEGTELDLISTMLKLGFVLEGNLDIAHVRSWKFVAASSIDQL
jgi:hypothetical protein